VRFARLLAVAAALGAQLGCSVMVHPSDVHVAWGAPRWPDVTLAELSQGRTEYVDRCAGCHTLVRPETQTPDDWPDLVAEMEDEQGVELSADERRRIVRYLMVAAAIPVAPKP
jgi:hypothetical protein